MILLEPFSEKKDFFVRVNVGVPCENGIFTGAPKQTKYIPPQDCTGDVQHNFCGGADCLVRAEAAATIPLRVCRSVVANLNEVSWRIVLRILVDNFRR